MSDRAPIRYRGFWDVPRIFLVQHAGQNYLFDCAFDDVLDDYPDNFKVYAIPEIADNELPKDWALLLERVTRYLGEIPVASVHFDATLRQSIDTAVLDEVARREPVV